MKRIGIIVAVIIIALIGGTITIKSLERVGQGEVGVVYSMKGGVQDETLKPGWHFISPFDKMSTYPASCKGEPHRAKRRTAEEKF